MEKKQPKKSQMLIERDKNNEEVIIVRKLAEELLETKMLNLDSEIEKHKRNLVNELIEYANEKRVIKTDKWDNIIETVEYSPIVINNRYLKPILSGCSKEPLYSPEKLAIVYEYYNEIIAEINDKIGHYPSSLLGFCKFASITMGTLRIYKNSQDFEMRTLVEKIYEQIGDDNITLGQLGKVSERMTMFKMRTQNEIVEKEQPKVNINLYEKPDIESIQKRLEEYKDFSKYKG